MNLKFVAMVGTSRHLDIAPVAVPGICRQLSHGWRGLPGVWAQTLVGGPWLWQPLNPAGDDAC